MRRSNLRVCNCVYCRFDGSKASVARPELRRSQEKISSFECQAGRASSEFSRCRVSSEWSTDTPEVNVAEMLRWFSDRVGRSDGQTSQNCFQLWISMWNVTFREFETLRIWTMRHAGTRRKWGSRVETLGRNACDFELTRFRYSLGYSYGVAASPLPRLLVLTDRIRP